MASISPEFGTLHRPELALPRADPGPTAPS
ncbi:hypothetical protein QE406_001941 [Microbacterium testaceum]|nr:hypothetical protein [Microbacterium sp. SORGH_AS_0969]MDQ1115932.1 hypothetical protein [Microbacterium testaceum]